jgi:pSer/pThr/pTyr-binding forkhead associated (FHA) protein
MAISEPHRYVLTILDNKNKMLTPKTHTLTEKSQLIGRANECNIQIPHKMVSRIHAKIEIEKNRVYITDLNSQNGVSIDGIAITAKTRLQVDQNFSIEHFTLTLLDTADKINDTATITLEEDRTESMITEQQLLPPKKIHESETILLNTSSTHHKNYSLEIIEEGEKNRYLMAEAVISIGRGLENTITLKDPMVSRKHLIISRLINDHFVNMAPESSGTLHVNGKETDQIILKHNDHIKIGRTDIYFIDENNQPTQDRQATLHATPVIKKTSPAYGVVIILSLLLIGLSFFFVLDPLHIISHEYESELKLAENAINNKKYHSAAEKFNLILRKYPNIKGNKLQQINSQLSIAEFNYGNNLWKTGHTEEALQQYQQALSHIKLGLNTRDLLLTTEDQLIITISQNIESNINQNRQQKAKILISWLDTHITLNKKHPILKQIASKWTQAHKVKRLLKKIEHKMNTKQFIIALQLTKTCQQQHPAVTACYLQMAKISQYFSIDIRNKLKQLNTQKNTSLDELNSLLSQTQQAIAITPEQSIKTIEEEINILIGKNNKANASSDNYDIDLFETDTFDINEFKR